MSRESDLLELKEGATVSELLRVLRLQTSNGSMEEPIWQTLAVAVNRQYAAASQVLHQDDEVALLPPVSGGVR